MMDAIVRNAKVNNRRRQQGKKNGLSYFKSASHVSSSVQSDLPSVITFRGRTTAGRALMGLPLMFKPGHGASEKRPVSLMTVCRRITYTIWKWSCLGVMAGGQLCLDLSVF